MSRIVRLAAAVIAVALTATITAIVADTRRAAPQQRSDRYELSLDSTPPNVIGSVRGATVQDQRVRYRLNLGGSTVIAVRPRPSCHYLTWQAATRGTDGR